EAAFVITVLIGGRFGFDASQRLPQFPLGGLAQLSFIDRLRRRVARIDALLAQDVGDTLVRGSKMFGFRAPRESGDRAQASIEIEQAGWYDRGHRFELLGRES